MDIEKYWKICFGEIGVDRDDAHFLIQAVPNYSPSSVVQRVKSVIAREIFSRAPEMKKELWGDGIRGKGCFINTVEQPGSEQVFAAYVQGQAGESEYKTLPKGQLDLGFSLSNASAYAPGIFILNTKKKSFYALLALLAFLPALARSTPDNDSHMEWWRDARFGMFIHWGLYSVAGGEWKGADYGKEQGGASAEWLMNSAKIAKEEYRNTLAPQFNPTDFDAAKWVSTAKQAGMKYMVITSKHHEGFCLFDTDATDYNVMDATPFKRDIIKELSEECAKQDIKFGVYYSQFKDWYHRSRGRDNPGTLSTQEYLDLVEKNLDELLSNYGEMAVLWFDVGGSDVIEADAQGARVRELQPNSVICSRLYSRKVPVGDRKYADFESLPDRMLPAERMTEDTETCMTMRHNWGYDRTDDAWKSPKDIIEFLALCSARGVNLLLNVGPTPEGVMLPEELERLEAVGEWMQVNGESIYGTHYSPVDYDFWWGAMTRKDQALYLHVLEWKPEGIEFNGIVGKPSKAYFLADPQRKALPVKYDTNGYLTTIEVPANALDSMNTVIAVEYDGPVAADPDSKGRYHWYTTRSKRLVEYNR